MFKVADESYAVENADAEVKIIATGVIGVNIVGVVIEFLENEFKHSKDIV